MGSIPIISTSKSGGRKASVFAGGDDGAEKPSQKRKLLPNPETEGARSST